MDSRDHTRVRVAGAMQKPGIGEKREQRTGKHDAATLPTCYHHLDGNMARRWTYV